MRKTELLFYLSLLIISALTVFDLFFNSGQPATMDGSIHITSMTQFATALLEGQFPVVWLNNFANYGLPVGIFSHQIPLYLGAILVILTKNSILSANLVVAIGVILANLLFYRFLRIYLSLWPSFFAVLLFSVAPFRILDIYIRGAIPEVFAACLLPLILIAMHKLFIDKKLSMFFALTLGFAALLLTHPMMLVIFSVFIFPYFIFLLYCLYQTRDNHKFYPRKIVTRAILFLFSLVLGLSVGSYYLFPLFLEKKYFYFGLSSSMLTNDFLSISSFFSTHWYYFYQHDIFTRGHVVQFGLPETLMLILGIIVFIFGIYQKKKTTYSAFLPLALIVGFISIFLTLHFAAIFYAVIPFLSDIQFPWRMLSVAVFVPPLIAGFVMEKYRFSWVLACVVIIIFAIRVPQLYGKNYSLHPQSYYESNLTNLYSINMNTVWTGKTEDYPQRTRQAKIISGEGNLIANKMTGTKRHYTITGKTPVRLVDYTFYFPGWHVFVDGVDTPIQFQDPNYRGIITYMVPAGHHQIEVVFKDTVIRKYAQFMSLAAILFIFLLFIFRKYPMRRIEQYV